MRLNSKQLASLLLILTLACVAGFGIARSEEKKNKKISIRKPDIVDIVFVNYNNWSYVMRNNGSYMNDGLDDNRGGGEFPRGSGKTIVRAGGFYIGTIKNGIPVVSEVEYNSEFQPGRITNSHVSFDQLTAQDPSMPSLKVYRIDRERHTDWPEDALHDAFGRPALIADAQTWAVFNDLDTSLNQESLQESPDPGLGIQVILESYAFNGPKIGDVVYLRFILENKTNTDYSQTYFGIWADPNVDQDYIDILGTDTVRNLLYAYNSGNELQSNSAVGLDILQGPIVNMNEIPIRDLLRNQNNRKVIEYDPTRRQFKNKTLTDGLITMLITSSVLIRNEIEPSNDIERYNIIRGLDRHTGIRQLGCGLIDYFVFRGNPLDLTNATGQGQGSCAVAGPNNPTSCNPLSCDYGDKQTLLNTGPFTIKTGESQEIWVGIVGASGIDRLDAVANLFATDDIAQNFFNAAFPAPAPEIPHLTVSASDGKVTLTWEDNAESYSDSSGIRLGISLANGFSADYVKNDFQGYRVYRSLTGLKDSYELLAQYDKIDSLGSVINRYLNENNHLEIKEIHLGDNTGLQYAYTDSGLVNGQNYYYSVTAYDAQPYIAGPDTMIYEGVPILRPAGLPVTLESSILANAVSAIPAKAAVNSTLKNIKVVPNPFYKYSSYETNFDKLIKFTHLPEVCTIRIFTVSGDLIKTIKHNSTSNNDRVNNRPYDENYAPAADATSIERWDLKTANGRYAASGMYIALVESSAGKKLVKFAVIQ